MEKTHILHGQKKKWDEEDEASDTRSNAGHWAYQEYFFLLSQSQSDWKYGEKCW